MRKLTMTLLVGAAAVAITAMTGGSAYAGEPATSRLSPGVLVGHSGADFQDDLGTGCRSHREDWSASPEF